MFSTLLPLSLLAATANAALSPIVRKGSFLFDSGTGDRFYIKGVAYSANSGNSSSTTAPSGSITSLDPLIDTSACTRDIANFQALGLNTIRVYQVNATQDHSGCMAALDAAGIYVIMDLATPAANDAISSSDPSWNYQLMNNFFATIDAFHNYTNVLGFNVGNEVMDDVATVQTAPFIKAAVRDVKSYMSMKNYSQLVGYTGTDDPVSRALLPFFLGCTNTDESIDYWGLNIYEWCGNNTFEGSGYAARTFELEDLGIPAFFSEYGCTSVKPRVFQEVLTLYSSNMTGVWSGGIVYEYFNEANDFGLGTLNSDGTFTTNQDFNNLKTQLAAVSPTSVAMSSYSPTVSQPVACPTQNATWPASTNLPPVPNQAACSCVVGNLSCTATSTTADSLASVGTAIGTVCGTPDANCSSIAANGTTGTYGDLSMCAPTDVLNIVLDAYYEGQNQASTACNFGGIAQLSTGGKPGSAAAVQSSIDSCLKLAPAVSTSGSSSSGSSSSGSSSAKSAAYASAPINTAALTMGLAALLAFAGLGSASILL